MDGQQFLWKGEAVDRCACHSARSAGGRPSLPRGRGAADLPGGRARQADLPPGRASGRLPRRSCTGLGPFPRTLPRGRARQADLHDRPTFRHRDCVPLETLEPIPAHGGPSGGLRNDGARIREFQGRLQPGLVLGDELRAKIGCSFALVPGSSFESSHAFRGEAAASLRILSALTGRRFGTRPSSP
jgi:hypothetical protein